MMAFEGRVFDAQTHIPITANVAMESAQSNVPYQIRSDGLSGNFLIYIPKKPQYNLSVNAPGYLPFEEDMDMSPQLDGKQINRDIYLTPIAKDQVFSINNLQFQRSKAILLQKSIPTLQKLVKMMEENPEMSIELAGHTDAFRPLDAKKELSLARVERIKDFLVDAGIDKNRIETRGYGGSRPIAPNDTEEHRAKNRRVEVKILDTGISRGN